MRTIEQIKNEIAQDYMRNENIAKEYGFTAGDNFAAHFSSVSIESILFYIFAAATWVMESLFEQHKIDVNKMVDDKIPLRAKWYCDKVLQFMKDKILIPDTDRYDTAGMTEDEINTLQVVKHCVAYEPKDSSMVVIKVAGAEGEKRCKLPAAVETQLSEYIEEIKGAGVPINLVNIDADVFNCEVDIYYDAMLLPENVQAECRNAIEHYIENLPFNGQYTNMALVDALQKIEGVNVVEFKNASRKAAGATVVLNIDALCTPDAGYFSAGELIINMCINE